VIPPDQFIPLAEQAGLIGPLTERVLEEAVCRCGEWRRRGLPGDVAVNLSMWNVYDPHLPDTVGTLLRAHAVPPTSLRLELTESAIMNDTARALDVLTRLNELGVHVSVDDFGTGYSSLAYLKRLPVDELKIDKSFVVDMATDSNDAAIVASTIGLGRGLGLRVVAEGVETRETWDLLARLGCDVAQGYYLSRPLPADAFTRWLREAPWAPA
jgi:EAL domain-containing protein (putative c-di-GMP-specific phosphodiesterase class I)